MKLFPKLALAISALLIGTSVCLGVSFYFTERRILRETADQERRTLVQNLVHITQESFLTNDDLLLVKYTRWMQQWNPSLVSVSVTSPEGEILAHSEPRQIGTSIKVQSPVSASDGRLVLTQAVHLGNRWAATASAGFSERALEDALHVRLLGLKRRLELIVSGAVAAGLLISFGLALSWTRPVESLSKAAKVIGQGRYALHLEAATRRHDELGQLARTFQSMAVSLQELDRMKDDFVSAVTHELRSPLGAIESYLNVIHEEICEGIPPATWKTYLERLRANTQRLTRYVNDLLDAAALERGTVALDRQPVPLELLLEDVVSFYQAKCMERHLLCRTFVPPGPLPRAWADPDKIRQVLMNLLANAIKFTPDHGTIELGATLITSGQVLMIYVKDSGPGIDPQDQARIFNKFEQVPSARRHANGPKGTGLGLAISRALVEMHGGTIGVLSQPRKGSCFYFTLPVEAAAEKAIRAAQEVTA